MVMTTIPCPLANAGVRSCDALLGIEATVWTRNGDVTLRYTADAWNHLAAHAVLANPTEGTTSPTATFTPDDIVAEQFVGTLEERDPGPKMAALAMAVESLKHRNAATADEITDRASQFADYLRDEPLQMIRSVAEPLFAGTVGTGTGGGWVMILVDRDTERYPEEGTLVEVYEANGRGEQVAADTIRLQWRSSRLTTERIDALSEVLAEHDAPDGIDVILATAGKRWRLNRLVRWSPTLRRALSERVDDTMTVWLAKPDEEWPT